MNTDFIIKNFRGFNNEGTFVPLRPITFLTGCNNSGKSSILKALCLLKDFCQQIESDYYEGKRLNLNSYKIDFHKYPNNVLGGFDCVLHRKSMTDEDEKQKVNSEDSKYITFETVVKSSWFLQDVIIHLEFGSLKKDKLNNGYLHSFSIKTLDGDLLCNAIENDDIMDLEGGFRISIDFSKIKKSFLHFIYGQYAVKKMQNKLYEIARSLGIEIDDAKEILSKTEEAFAYNYTNKTILDDLGPTAILYLHEWYVSQEENGRPVHFKVPEDSVAPNSPTLGVYCYYPCFEASNAETLHEYVSQKEDELLFKVNMKYDLYERFTSRENVSNTYIYNESDLPDKANWTVVIMAMDIINKILTVSDKSYIIEDEINKCVNYLGEDTLNNYFVKAIEEVFANILPDYILLSPTIIAHPRRVYSLEDNSDFSNSLKLYFETVGYNNGQCKFINKWLKHLGIAHHAEIKLLENGYAASVILYEDKNKKSGMLLADKGLGAVQLFTVLLKIQVAILKASNNRNYNYLLYTEGMNWDIVRNLRDGNQLFPIMATLEEPECHLHPSLQSQLADIIVDAYKLHGVHFLIESHSEYLIRKLQLLIAQKEISSDNVSLLYVNPINRPSYLPAISNIGVDADGLLRNSFGTGFFDESTLLSNKLFRLNM